MAKRDLPKRLFKNPDRVSSYQHNSSSPAKLRKQMSRDHVDVLQNIESALVSRYREDPDIDDRVVAAALRACLRGTEPDDPREAELVLALEATREFREDITDDIWRAGLHVVEDSVKLHSGLRPGQTSYLSFAERYV